MRNQRQMSALAGFRFRRPNGHTSSILVSCTTSPGYVPSLSPKRSVGGGFAAHAELAAIRGGGA